MQPYPETLKNLAPGQLQVQLSVPSFWHVVMGAGGKPAAEVHEDMLERFEVPLYKRKGGGGTVLLGPNTLVITVHAGVAHLYRNQAYFQAVNRALISVFADWKAHPYRQRGLSDIAVGDRKLVGSSIFRRKHYLLYQASLLLDLNLELMHVLLKHPPREPDYRDRRAHGDFLTSLKLLGVTLTPQELRDDLRAKLPGRLAREFRLVDGPAVFPPASPLALGTE